MAHTLRRGRCAGILNAALTRVTEAPWADRVQVVDAEYDGPWELPVLGAVAAPTAVLVRPDGYVARVGDGAQQGLEEALTTWFGPPSAA